MNPTASCASPKLMVREEDITYYSVAQILIEIVESDCDMGAGNVVRVW